MAALGMAGIVLTVWGPAPPVLTAGVVLVLLACLAGFAAVGPATLPAE